MWAQSEKLGSYCLTVSVTRGAKELPKESRSLTRGARGVTMEDSAMSSVHPTEAQNDAVQLQQEQKHQQFVIDVSDSRSNRETVRAAVAWSFDPRLNDAREAARAAYMLSKNAANRQTFGRRAPATVTSSNLSLYWSGEDPQAIERKTPIIIRSILDANDIKELHAAASSRASPCDPNESNSTFLCEELRSVVHDVAYSNEHVALYLHRGRHFSLGWPALCERLVHAMRAHQPSDWVNPRTKLNVRCVELHTYAVGGGLIDPGHKDNGSKLTMVVQVSDASEFEGGKFVTWSEGECVVHDLGSGDAVLFHSEKCHNISPVLRGTRRSLVIELWIAPENSVDRFS